MVALQIIAFVFKKRMFQPMILLGEEEPRGEGGGAASIFSLIFLTKTTLVFQKFHGHYMVSVLGLESILFLSILFSHSCHLQRICKNI